MSPGRRSSIADDAHDVGGQLWQRDIAELRCNRQIKEVTVQQLLQAELNLVVIRIGRHERLQCTALGESQELVVCFRALLQLNQIKRS